LSLKCNKETVILLKEELYGKFISQEGYLAIKTEQKESEEKAKSLMLGFKNEFEETKGNLTKSIQA
jgi:hypothetical protein